MWWVHKKFVHLRDKLLKEMEKLAKTIIKAIDDKKGSDIVSIDLSGFDGAICSQFIICNADSTTQVASIAAGIEKAVFEEIGEKVWRTEGLTNGVWVVMDYGNIFVHIFQTETREFYQLEQAWEHAPTTQH